MGKVFLFRLLLLLSVPPVVFAQGTEVISLEKIVPYSTQSKNNLSSKEATPPTKIIQKKTNLPESSPPAMTVEDAILLALRYNPNVQSAELQRRADKFALRVAENNFEWQYALTGRGAYEHGRSTSSLSPSTTNSTSTNTTQLAASAHRKTGLGTEYTVTTRNPTTNGTYNPSLAFHVVQPLLRGFGPAVTKAPLYNAADQEQIDKLSLRSTLINTVSNVINSYLKIIQEQYNIHTAQLAVESYKKTIQLDNALIKAGRKSPTDVIQAKADLASEHVRLQDAKNQMVNSRLAFLNLLGLPANLPFTIPSDAPPIERCPYSVEQAYAIALKNNISYQVALLNLNILKRNLVVAKDNSRIALDMQATAIAGNGVGAGPNKGIESLYNNNNSSINIELNLEVPVNNYALKQAVINAQVALDQANISLAQQKRELHTTMVNDITNLNYQWEQIKLAENALRLQQKSQHILEEKLTFGLVSTFEISSRQRELDLARDALINSKISYWNSFVQFYADMGITLDFWHIAVRY